MAGAGYSSSVDDAGNALSGITQTVGGGINAPAIQNGSSFVTLAFGAAAVIAALALAVYAFRRR